MAEFNGITAARAEEILGESVTSGEVNADGALILNRENGTQINAGAFSNIIGNIVAQQVAAALADIQAKGNFLPVGTFIDGGQKNVPTGWLLCDGRAISRQDFSALFNAMGTDWGVGDNNSTFNLPDFRDRGRIGAGELGVGTTEGAGYGSRNARRSHNHGHGNNFGMDGVGDHSHSTGGPSSIYQPASGGGSYVAKGDHGHSISNSGAHNHNFHGQVFDGGSADHAFAVVRVFVKF